MQFAAICDDQPVEEDYVYSPEPGRGSHVPYFVAGILFAAACLVVLVVLLTRTGHQQNAGRNVPRQPDVASRTIPRQADASGETDSGLSEAAGAIAGILLLFVIVAVCVAYIVGVILMLAWVARDSRSRGVDGGAVWVMAILIFGFIGLLVYLASRPHGILVPCARCGNQKLNYALTCPHCGETVRSGKR
jgi:hypothetical protein